MIVGLGKTEQIVLYAEDYYSRNFIEVKQNEVYTFSVEKKSIWVDAFFWCTAEGFWNPVLLNGKKRVKNTPCFTLCGTIGQDEEGHFVISEQLEKFPVTKEGNLYFFANDHYNEKYYRNNKGHMLLNVTRIG